LIDGDLIKRAFAVHLGIGMRSPGAFSEYRTYTPLALCILLYGFSAACGLGAVDVDLFFSSSLLFSALFLRGWHIVDMHGWSFRDFTLASLRGRRKGIRPDRMEIRFLALYTTFKGKQPQIS
jgi:hypothetical protein